MTIHKHYSFFYATLLAGLWAAVGAGELDAAVDSSAPPSLSRTVLKADDLKRAVFEMGAPQVEAVAGGSTAMRFDEPFEGRIDLVPLGIKAQAFDFIKLTIKASQGAFLRLAVENYPQTGDLCYWYPLDTMRSGFDWTTIWVDLRLPEELKAAGDTRMHWRAGMGQDSRNQRGLRIKGMVKDLKSKAQGPERQIWIEDIRFVKTALLLDWDQTKAPYTWGQDRDLVYTYPLTLTNRLDRPITAKLKLTPLAAGSATGELEQETIALDPGQARTVAARISLPAADAAKAAPLYCERFLVTAEAEGIADSTVTILRSSDPIHLTVTVPIPEEKLKRPLFPVPKSLPAGITRFDEAVAREHAAKAPAALIANALKHGLYQYNEAVKKAADVQQYRKTLIAAAYLYDMTGDEKYLLTARQLLLALPSIWRKWSEAELQQPIQIVSSGIVARHGDLSHGTLGLGWLVLGTMRSPYLYSDGGNARDGSCAALAYAYDMVAAKLDEADRRSIVDGFFLPAGIRSRNHYIGDGNQQMTANVNALYAGLTARNWPLVSFAVSSEHGLHAVLETCFDDDGVQLRKNYQTYTLRPVFWGLELLRGAGADAYPRYAARLKQCAEADTAAKGQGGAFKDRYFWDFVRENWLK